MSGRLTHMSYEEKQMCEIICNRILSSIMHTFFFSSFGLFLGAFDPSFSLPKSLCSRFGIEPGVACTIALTARLSCHPLFLVFNLLIGLPGMARTQYLGPCFNTKKVCTILDKTRYLFVK